MCVLHVSGTTLDPADLLRGTSLEAYRVHKAGEPRRRRKPDGPKWESSGFSVAVSDAPWSDLARQVADAFAFLRRHTDDIGTVRSRGPIDDIRLDFPIFSRIGDRTAAQFEFFPADFIAKLGALRIGLELSIYPPPDDAEGLRRNEGAD